MRSFFYSKNQFSWFAKLISLSCYKFLRSVGAQALCGGSELSFTYSHLPCKKGAF